MTDDFSANGFNPARIEDACALDKAHFATRPLARYYVRPFVPGEATKQENRDALATLVIQLQPGVRARSFWPSVQAAEAEAKRRLKEMPER